MKEIVVVETELSVPYFFAVIEDGFVVKSYFSNDSTGEKITSKIGKRLKKDLKYYFSGLRDVSDYPTKFKATNFTLRVLEEVKKIPYGETRTYKDVAERIGVKGYRAVGRALSLNPVPIIIPCHRVVGSKDLGGYMGKKGERLKRELLMLEKIELDK
jgi:O-6-methylguanine DNA methyltransferase